LNNSNNKINLKIELNKKELNSKINKLKEEIKKD